MKYAIVTAAAAAVRKKPSHKAEMTNQLFFGEAVKIIKRKDTQWLQVQSLYDNYKGWITHHLLAPVNEEEALALCRYVAPCALNTLYTPSGTMHIPAGSFLLGFQGKAGSIGAFTYSFSGTARDTEGLLPTGAQIVANAYLFLNAPYLWGGKTVLGIDCSGLAQTVFKLCGIPLLRDARQQATQGTVIKKLSAAQPGDLAFFDDKEEIVHVGILINTQQIIHAAGTVRVDNIDAKGIINAATQQRTHRLKMIRRLL